MRAGKLDRTIQIQRWTTDPEPDDMGTVTPGFTALATLRAQIVQASTDEYIRSAGATDETVIIFRTRWLAGVTNSDRVSYQGAFFNIKEVKEIGRREGLELRCQQVVTQ
ncbi:phage head closure protein [Rhizobium sp. HT1-10]|uniref:phage head closure protein n=1 Tax=Rhizobium sp. HT1-10 TaxID=3111638 RepID=UPI003C2302BF